MRPRHPNVEAFEAQMGALPVTQRCLFCTWEWSGKALEGHTEGVAHRLQAHPEIKIKRRPPSRNLQSFRQPTLKSEDREDIFVERDRRARLLGITIES